MTIEPMPSAVKSPPMSAPQTHEKRMAIETVMSRKRPTSTKIEGRRSRQLPFRAVVKSATLRPLMSTMMTRNPSTVATMRLHDASTCAPSACATSASRAATGAT